MKLSTLLMACLVAASALTSCTTDDTPIEDLQAARDAAIAALLPVVEWDTTALAETESVPAGDNDYVENSTFTRHVTITFSGATATVDGDRSVLRSVVTDGAGVTIRSGARDVEYILAGSTTNGYLKVYSDYKYQLTLNGVSIANPSGAPINNQGGKSLYVVLASGTSNELSGGPLYATPDGEDEKAALFSEGQIIFSGGGTLTVTDAGRHGICSDDYLLFRPGPVINVTTTLGHGVKANDGVTIRGGVLNVLTYGAGAKGINSDAGVTISGGRTTVVTQGGSLVETADTTSAAGIKCDSTYVQTAGAVALRSTGEGGKGINSHVDVDVSGGTLSVVATGRRGLSSPKGIKADRSISLRGGTLCVYSARAEAVEAAALLTVAPGYSLYESGGSLFRLQY